MEYFKLDMIIGSAYKVESKTLKFICFDVILTYSNVSFYSSGMFMCEQGIVPKRNSAASTRTFLD